MEMNKDFLALLTTKALDAGILPTALDDMWARVEIDEPTDIGGYLARLKETAPHLFNLSHPNHNRNTADHDTASPVIPPQSDKDYNKKFLADLEKIAGPTEEKDVKPPHPPREIARGDSQAFLDNVERIALGQCEVK